MFASSDWKTVNDRIQIWFFTNFYRTVFSSNKSDVLYWFNWGRLANQMEIVCVWISVPTDFEEEGGSRWGSVNSRGGSWWSFPADFEGGVVDEVPWIRGGVVGGVFRRQDFEGGVEFSGQISRGGL